MLMRPVLRYLLMGLLIMGSVTACTDDEDENKSAYPSIVTEMVIMRCDENSKATIETDEGIIYQVTNEIPGLLPNSIGRMLCGFVADGNGGARIYQLKGVRLLKDLSEIVTQPFHDPVGFVSQWQKGKFINLHILPKTQDDPSKHSWGFLRTGQRTNEEGGTTHEIAVYHNQGGDPLAYSSDYYLTLVIDSVSKSFADKDSVELTIKGFAKTYTWTYGK